MLISCLLYVAANAHRLYFEVPTFHFFCRFPAHFCIFGFCFVMALSDCLHPQRRLVINRYGTAMACALFLFVSLAFRLPGSKEKFTGIRTIVIFGAETWSNVDLSAKFSLVLCLRLMKASWSAWRFPTQLAFFHNSITCVVDVAESTNAADSQQHDEVGGETQRDQNELEVAGAFADDHDELQESCV